jgi:hypothetical protein
MAAPSVGWREATAHPGGDPMSTPTHLTHADHDEHDAHPPGEDTLDLIREATASHRAALIRIQAVGLADDYAASARLLDLSQTIKQTDIEAVIRAWQAILSDA